MIKEGKVLPYNRKSTNKCRSSNIFGGGRNLHQLLRKHLNWFRQESLKNAIQNGWKFTKKRNTNITWSHGNPQEIIYWLKGRGNTVILQWRNLEDTTLTKWSKLTSPIIEQIEIICTEKEYITFFGTSYQNYTTSISIWGNIKQTQSKGYVTK